jgi:hypothetical protein
VEVVCARGRCHLLPIDQHHHFGHLLLVLSLYVKYILVYIYRISSNCF